MALFSKSKNGVDVNLNTTNGLFQSGKVIPLNITQNKTTVRFEDF